MPAIACGAGQRDAARFEGHARTAIATPAELRTVDSLPDGHESLGRVSAHCTLTRGQVALQGEWLSDVDCSRGRLVRALRERAADVGGELLVDLHCGSQINKGALQRINVFCRAEVARASDSLLGRRSLRPGRRSQSPALPSEQEPRASEGWRIRADYTPQGTGQQRPPRRADLVEELAILPVSHVRLGDIVTRCESGCSQRGARAGLLTVAARLGANALVGTRCVRHNRGFFCTGTASAYEVDPELDPRAR